MKFIKVLIIVFIFLVGLLFLSYDLNYGRLSPTGTVGLGMMGGAVFLYLVTGKKADKAPKAPMDVPPQKDESSTIQVSTSSPTEQKPNPFLESSKMFYGYSEQPANPGASAWGDTTRTNRKDPVKPQAAEFFEAEPAAPSKPGKSAVGKGTAATTVTTNPDIPDVPDTPFVSDEALEANEELADAISEYAALRDEYEQAKTDLAEQQQKLTERQQELANKLAALEEAGRAIEDAQESYEHTGDWDREAAKEHVRSYLEGLAHYDTSMAMTDMDAYIDSLDEEPDLSELENMALNAADLHDNYDSYEGVPSRYDDEEDYF